MGFHDLGIRDRQVAQGYFRTLFVGYRPPWKTLCIGRTCSAHAHAFKKSGNIKDIDIMDHTFIAAHTPPVDHSTKGICSLVEDGRAAYPDNIIEARVAKLSLRSAQERVKGRYPRILQY